MTDLDTAAAKIMGWGDSDIFEGCYDTPKGVPIMLKKEVFYPVIIHAGRISFFL